MAALLLVSVFQFWYVFDAMASEVSGRGSVQGVNSLFLALQCFIAPCFSSLSPLPCQPAILSTMDICVDGFGFMLAFGDLAWVPFTYTLQGRYLTDFPNQLSWAEIVGIVALQLIGELWGV